MIGRKSAKIVPVCAANVLFWGKKADNSCVFGKKTVILQRFSKLKLKNG